MARGNKTGGRQPGSKNKATIERETLMSAAAEKAIAAGCAPLEVMLENMRFAHEQSADLIAKIMEVDPSVDTLKELLKFRQIAQDCAKDAAPYVHPRLAAIEHTGKDGEALMPEASSRELARAVLGMLREAGVDQ